MPRPELILFGREVLFYELTLRFAVQPTAAFAASLVAIYIAVVPMMQVLEPASRIMHCGSRCTCTPVHLHLRTGCFCGGVVLRGERVREGTHELAWREGVPT